MTESRKFITNHQALTCRANLSRRTALAGFGAGALSLAAAPMFITEAAPLSYTIEPEAIAEGVWVLRGAQEAITFENGGAIANITIFDTSEGAVVVDTGPSRRYGVALSAIARKLTGKAIARVYITHFHPDHVFGNQGFDVATIAASQAVISGLEALGAGFSDAMYYLARDWMRGTEVVLPSRVITSGIEQIGDRRFEIIELAGHTDSDLVIVEKKSGVIVAGDLAFLDRAPTTPHADLETWRASLTTLSGYQGDFLIPGHGPVEPGQRALAQTRQWLDMLDERVTGAFEKGLSMTEAMTVDLPQELASLALARYEFSRSVMHLYPRLEAERLEPTGGPVQ